MLSFIAGQQSFIPSLVNFSPPSPFNGTDDSLSTFGSTCVLISGGLYECTNNTNNPLFDCSTSNNSYYGWDNSQSRNTILITANFSSHFQSMNILVTFLISTSSNVSAPSLLQYGPFQNQGGFASSTIQDNPPPNLPEGPYQHNITVSQSPGVTFDGMIITITPNTTSQWVAINRIIFCAAATEGL